MLRVSKRALKPLGAQDAYSFPKATIWLGLGYHISQVLLITACDWNCESLDTPEYQQCWRLGQNSDQTWNLGNMLPSIRRAAVAARKMSRIGQPLSGAWSYRLIWKTGEYYYFTSSLEFGMDLDLSRDEVDCGDLYGGGSI